MGHNLVEIGIEPWGDRVDEDISSDMVTEKIVHLTKSNTIQPKKLFLFWHWFTKQEQTV